MTQPGVNVVAGEYLLAVQGRDVRAAARICISFFEETAGKSIVIRVGPDPDGANSREVTVVPVESERGLRNFAWIEDNRRKVDQMSGGRSHMFTCRTRRAAATPISTATSSAR